MDLEKEYFLHNHAVCRLKRSGVDTTSAVSIVAALENEINEYRDKIFNLERQNAEVEFTEEKTSDGGSAILENSACYQDFVAILISNGYRVALESTGDNKLEIEFWKEK